MYGGVKQVVSGLLERRRVQHAVLHLGDTKPRDAKHLALSEGGGLSQVWGDREKTRWGDWGAKPGMGRQGEKKVGHQGTDQDSMQNPSTLSGIEIHKKPSSVSLTG